MNQDIKKRWVEALRSGKYKQTRGALKDDQGFCCLGVLCDLAAQDGIGKWEGVKLDGFHDGDNCTWSLPTQKVVHWAGIISTNPKVFMPATNSELSFINDEGMSFEGIAKLIEEQL